MDATGNDRRAGAPLEQDLDTDPLRQFTRWFDEAREAGIELPEAAALATADADGQPSVRMVLVKGADERGFLFHTGYGSRKGRELEENPRAALLFYWHVLGRQVRVEGPVKRVPEEESAAYFATRPRESRLAAWASQQSETIESREALDAGFEEAARRFADAEVPLPPGWGGFRLLPDEIEFWQHRANRLHDRLRFRRSGQPWTVERLAP
jgi:pyridoxamine 5'-phosphate oxidase